MTQGEAIPLSPAERERTLGDWIRAHMMGEPGAGPKFQSAVATDANLSKALDAEKARLQTIINAGRRDQISLDRWSAILSMEGQAQ